MAWDGTFDWRQDNTVFSRKWELFIKPENRIKTATVVVLDYGTQLVLHNDGYAPQFEEAVIPVRDQLLDDKVTADLDKNIEVAKALAEKLVRALYG